MKKLLFILFMITTIGAGAQSMQIDYRHYVSIDTFSISTSDTSWNVDWDSAFSAYKGPWFGSISVHCKDLTGTLDGTLKLQATSDSAVHWVDMNMASAVMASADTTFIFHVPWYVRASYDRVRLHFTRNSLTGGKVIPSIRLFKSNTR